MYVDKSKVLPWDSRTWTAHGFAWCFDEDGARFYQRQVIKPAKQIDAGTWTVREAVYECIRLLPSDLTPDNFELMCRLGLTNTNEVEVDNVL